MTSSAIGGDLTPVDDSASLILDEIESARALCLEGRFQDALILVDTLLRREDLSTRSEIAVLRAAARVYVFRGYPQTAAECMKKALSLTRDNLDFDEVLGLQIHAAFVNVVACIDDVNIDETIDHAERWLSRQKRETLLTTNILEAEGYISRILLVRQQLHQRKDQDAKPKLKERLEPIMAEAIATKRYDAVWILFEPFAGVIGLEAIVPWLEQLLDNSEGMKPAILGLLTLEVADRLAGSGRIQDSELRLIQADAAFSACNHAFGPVEARKIRLRYGMVRHEDMLKELIEILVQYMNMDYPLGVVRSTTVPLQLAFERGDFRTYINLQHVFNDVCKISGLVHERLLLQVQLLAAMNAGSGHHGKVLELGQPLYAECCERRFWTFAFLVAQVISLAHNQAEWRQLAHDWALKALRLCQTHCLMSESTAAFNYAHLLSFDWGSDVSAIESRVSQIKDLLQPYIDSDIDSNQVRLACEKLSLMATADFKVARSAAITADTSLKSGFASLDRVESLVPSLAGRDGAIVKGDVEEARVIQLLWEGKRRQDNAKEEEAVSRLDDLIKLYQDHDLRIQEANKYQMRGMCHVQMWQKRLSGTDKLIAAEASLRTACNKFETISSMQFFLGCRHQLSRLYVEAWDRGLLPIENCLLELQALELTADEIRRELAAAKGLNALLQKQHFAARPSLRDLYDWATGVCCVGKQFSELWHWTQKRKARSLSEMLGLGIIRPAWLKDQLQSDTQALAQYEIWLDAEKKLEQAAPNERAYIRQEIEDVELKLKQFAPFEEFTSLRDGVTKGVEQIRELNNAFTSAKLQRKIKFVDWLFHRNEIYMLISDTATVVTQPDLHKLDLTIGRVGQWLQTHFGHDADRKRCLSADSFEDSDSPMRELDALIAPLNTLTAPDDLLILCPTSSLHRIPLHALALIEADPAGLVPLIARNPVLYTPSFTALMTCIRRSTQADNPGSASFLGCFDQQKEALEIDNQMRRLAGNLGGSSSANAHLTKSSFKNQVRHARLIHYHGHCQYSVDNILSQSLVLSPEQGPAFVSATSSTIIPDSEVAKSTSEASYHASPVESGVLHDSGQDDRAARLGDQAEVDEISRGESEHASATLTDLYLQPSEPDAGGLLLSAHNNGESSSNLTVEEIFQEALLPALVVMIACSSSVQAISTGDEPLGLISGLLCAGAATVIGASWPVPSGTGRKFSDIFYKALLESLNRVREHGEDCTQAVACEDKFVDLAVTLQETVKLMMDCRETSETYAWSAFSLWGSWGFRADTLIPSSELPTADTATN